MKQSASTGSMARLNAGATAWAAMDKVVRALRLHLRFAARPCLLALQRTPRAVAPRCAACMTAAL
jgi:hypothetical protein